jgi:wobble nucleotide-excising tRNase
MSEQKLDAILQLVSAINKDLSEFKAETNERFDRLEAHAVNTDKKIDRLEAHAVNTDKKIDRLEAHAVNTDKKIDRLETYAVNSDKKFEILDKRTARIEKQGIAIGIELKEDVKTIDERLKTVEKEDFRLH